MCVIYLLSKMKFKKIQNSFLPRAAVATRIALSGSKIAINVEVLENIVENSF